MTLRLLPFSSVDVAEFVVQLESISHLQHLAGITARIPSTVMIAEVEAIAQDADMCCMSNDHYRLHMAHAQYARQLRDSFVVVPVV